MSIDAEKFKLDISNAYIKLIDSKRGIAAALAKSIGKPGSFITEVKRGKPVNTLHLKAVSIVFGPEKVIELLSSDNNFIQKQNRFKNPERAEDLINQLAIIEALNPRLLDQIDKYVSIILETARDMVGNGKAQDWDGLERRLKNQNPWQGVERRKKKTGSK